MFYLLLVALTLAGVFLLLNGEWIFRIQQDRRIGALVTVGMLAFAVVWARVRATALPGLPDLYPLVAVTAGLFLGFGWGALGGAVVAVTCAMTTLAFGARPHSGAELAALLLVYGLMGALAGRISDRLRSMAFTDSLTGLHNRRYFFEQLEPEVARALRYTYPLSVLIVDLDYFKFYNDRLGHVAGDMALRRFGDVLRTGSREGDLIARYGGEEFIIALSHTDGDAARLYAERLRENVQQMYGHGPIQLTVSVGIASLPGYESLDALVQAADAALYQSKGERNRVTLAVPESGQTEAAATSPAGPAHQG